MQKHIFKQSAQASFIGVVFSALTWLLISKFFDIGYVWSLGLIFKAFLVIFAISFIASHWAKINVEKELRLPC
jgi:TctA family transporter